MAVLALMARLPPMVVLMRVASFAYMGFSYVMARFNPLVVLSRVARFA